MKKAFPLFFFCLILVCVTMLSCTACGEEAADLNDDSGVRIAFEDGFSLQFPEGWRYYAPDEAMRAEGVLYCLSDEDGKNWLYIGAQETQLEDIESLHEQILSEDAVKFSGVYSFGGVPFVVYDLAEGDVSCCDALLEGKAISFRFTPQSDSSFMAIATRIMRSFALV